MKTSKSSIYQSRKFPDPKRFGSSAILIYDQRLHQFLGRWIDSFSAAYSVKAGEKLKAVENFSGHIIKISKLTEKFRRSECVVVALGGGSVGDFAGFVASVLRRGVSFVNIPSTWLAAIDSAHGGKTALNVAAVKNQIGTFYPAIEVHLVQSLLMHQTDSRTRDALGELVKIAIIDGGAWTQRLARDLAQPENKLDLEGIFCRYLKYAIQSNLKVVALDPVEKKGIRELLNLGHTLGHVFEAFYKIPHGRAVSLGLEFSYNWSLSKKILKNSSMFEELIGKLPLSRPKKKIPLKEFRRLLWSDKKLVSSSKVNFIFIRSMGSVIRKQTKFSEIETEARRQAWV